VGIVHALGHFLVTLRSENKIAVANVFAQSAFRICKLAAWISEDAGDEEGMAFALLGALLTTHSADTDEYRWALETAQRLPDDTMRADVLTKLERGKKRWAGERVEGDYHGDTIWQAIQNVASALGIDVGDENDPLVRGLRVAAKDSSSKRVLATCEHLLDSLGATGPIARQIARMFNITTAGSKVIHCTLTTTMSKGRTLTQRMQISGSVTAIRVPTVSPGQRNGAEPRKRSGKSSPYIVTSFSASMERQTGSGSPTRIKPKSFVESRDNKSAVPEETAPCSS